MESYSVMAALMASPAKHIPNSERAAFANKASECLDKSLQLSAWFNQLATGYDRDLGDSELLTTTLNYVNLTLSDLSHVLSDLKNESEAKAKSAARTEITTSPPAKGGC